jgi:sensor histidine kinase YesM
MERFSFLFSNQPKFRIARHSIFWVVWLILQTLILTLPRIYTTQNAGVLFLQQFLASVVLLLPNAFMVYTLLYFILPRFIIKGRYFPAVLWTLSILLFSILAYAFLNITVLNQIRAAFAETRNNTFQTVLTWDTFAILAFWGSYTYITTSAFALTIKLLKLWYIKEQKNIQLQKENLISKTQLLQSQIHPHFLFNTLNNIYSNAIPGAPKASQMIMRLSSILRYILYECNKPLVPLKKELDMINDYIALETMRYDDKLEVTVDTVSNSEDHLIAPLLLLPLVENCFKHGTSNVIEKPWVNLRIDLKENNLSVKLVNGKAPVSVYNNEGIGIRNVQNRLELLYKDRHDFKVVNDEEVFGISLNVELKKAEKTIQQ